jgi:hypothetical protein
MRHASTRFLVLFTFLFQLSVATTGASSDGDLGPLTLDHSRVPWPVPETLLQNLRAKDYETFDKALGLVGVPETSEAAIFDPLRKPNCATRNWA